MKRRLKKNIGKTQQAGVREGRFFNKKKTTCLKTLEINFSPPPIFNEQVCQANPCTLGAKCWFSKKLGQTEPDI